MKGRAIELNCFLEEDQKRKKDELKHKRGVQLHSPPAHADMVTLSRGAGSDLALVRLILRGCKAGESFSTRNEEKFLMHDF